MDNNILCQDFVIYNGKKCILSTSEIPGNTPIYETILMKTDYTEIDCRRTPEEKTALRLHIASAEKLRNKTARADGAAVGMLFYVSWGYEQTNISFFQIVELKGKSSARVRAVSPEVLTEYAVSGMSAYYTYKNGREILPPRSDCWIENDAAGDVKKLQKEYNGNGLCFSIRGYMAHEYNGRRLYESWYA